MIFGSILGFEFLGVWTRFGSGSSVGEQKAKDLELSEPKLKSVSPSNKHLTRIRGKGFFPPKLLLFSMNLTKFSYRMLI